MGGKSRLAGLTRTTDKMMAGEGVKKDGSKILQKTGIDLAGLGRRRSD